MVVGANRAEVFPKWMISITRHMWQLWAEVPFFGSTCDLVVKTGITSSANRDPPGQGSRCPMLRKGTDHRAVMVTLWPPRSHFTANNQLLFFFHSGAKPTYGFSVGFPLSKKSISKLTWMNVFHVITISSWNASDVSWLNNNMTLKLLWNVHWLYIIYGTLCMYYIIYDIYWLFRFYQSHYTHTVSIYLNVMTNMNVINTTHFVFQKSYGLSAYAESNRFLIPSIMYVVLGRTGLPPGQNEQFCAFVSVNKLPAEFWLDIWPLVWAESVLINVFVFMALTWLLSRLRILSTRLRSGFVLSFTLTCFISKPAVMCVWGRCPVRTLNCVQIVTV